MIAAKLRPFSTILVEDDYNKNILPLLIEILQSNVCTLNIFNYEHSSTLWGNVFKNKVCNCFEEFDPNEYSNYTSTKCTILIDSINQMILCCGWYQCIKFLRKLQNDPNVCKLVLILHHDCLPFTNKLQKHLNHLCTATISYDLNDSSKVVIKMKKGGKVVMSEEKLIFDNVTSTLISQPIINKTQMEEEPEKLCPGKLSTFKIEVDQTQKLQKYNLKLPYMSKINEGQSTIYYEPDAVDDWDDEDPDDDLDI